MALPNKIKWLFIGMSTLIWHVAGVEYGFAQNRNAYRTAVDSTAADSLPTIIKPPHIAYPFSVSFPKFYYINLRGEEVQVALDSSGLYLSRRFRFGIPIGLPYVMDFEEYANHSRQQSVQSNWNQFIREYEKTADERAGLLNFQFDVPGSEESAFATIFGKNEVNIEVNGIANLNIGASVQKNENPRIPPGQQRQIDPTFNQNLQLNIRGTIGDKLSIRTNWDTEAAFDFQNRVNIVYDGYENEILQRIELGNVSIETGNTLIRGGSALFGIKGVAQLGALRITSILSQQKGRRNSQVITGGATEQAIKLRPADYEYDQNFFLAFYTRQQFEENMSDPQNIGQALQLIEVNVWKLRESSQSTKGQHQAIALVDLGIVQNADSTYLPPNSKLDAFPESLLNRYRDPSIGVSADDFNVPSTQFVEGYFVPLQEGVDYRLNRPLGYISLSQSLGARQALAVSFKYINKRTGEVVSVGNVSQTGGDRIFLKLLRPQTVTTDNPVWDLMMKNIYSLGVNNVSREGLKIAIKYTEQNIPSSSLPQRSTILLKDLGLDRVDQQGAPNPDNAIDFSTGTLDAINGIIIFPYLQPFGDRIKELLANTGLSQNAIEQIAFEELYEVKKPIARQKSKNSYYLIEGTSKGSVSESYALGFSPVRGSVRVYANGVQLQEGTEFIVDYSIGNVTILDEQYLRKGQKIRIEYENNQLVQIEQKTFTGVRAEYAVSNNINIGATYFRLKEKPIQDKVRIGNEPINNTVLGLDVNAQFDLPWLTRLVDKIPFLDTRTPSFITFSGEFAQLRPGVARTTAVEKAIDGGRLFPDEERGVSFIADFEGADIELSFMHPSQWHLAAAPAAVPGYMPDAPYFQPNPPQIPNTTLSAKIARSDLRSQFSWYSLPRNIVDILGNVQRTSETQIVRVTDVFPNRDVLSKENVISTLDVWYNPTDRGVYNYNDQLKNLLQNEPERTWGGFVTTLPPGQEDLTQNNIQFLEFWVQPILPGGRSPTAQDLQDYEGKIYIDIGLVSEDVIPNYKTNTEDGLARRPEDLQIDNLKAQARSYIPVPPPAPEGQFTNDLREEADVGLDGAPNTGGFDNQNEHTLFGDFIQSVKATYGVGSKMYQQVSNDPSNDDYVYYGESEVSNLPLQKRFYRLYGHTDGNTPANTDDSRALTNRPNTEGLITPSIVQLTNAYFQYEIAFNPADFDELEPGNSFIVDKIEGERQSDRWYKIRIPLDEWTRKIGNIDGFQNVSYIRFWMSGYEKPFTLRFATFELVGSQWREAESVNQKQNQPAEFNISSVNIEEASRRQPIPYRLPEGVIRSINRSGQRQTIANEQSLVLEVENLGPGELNMIKRVYPGGFNMVNYSNVRMYIHGEGFDERGDLELVVRFGSDLVNNYYEYRQPITPTVPHYNFSDAPLSEIPDAERREEARQVWLYKQNSMNILLSAFNQLKQLRSQQGAQPDERYIRTDLLPEAPPGTSIAIKGNPSLDRIGEIGLGVINPYDPANPKEGGEPFVSGQVWFNEMRVSGFDNRNGWAANGQVKLKLADFASVNLNINRQTDGFGSLTSRLGQRRTSDEFAYNLYSTFYLDTFIPDRYGWNIPVSFSARRSISTPRYLPNQGDITLEDFKNAVQARDDISDKRKDELIDQKITASQTYLESYSVNIVNLSKERSESLIGRYLLDKTTLNFVYNTTYQRNPQYAHQKDWNYSGSLLYDINFRNTYLFRPFGFLENVPLLHPLAGIQLGYTPASITASFGIDRDYNEQQRRGISDNTDFGSGNFLDLQQFHSFTYNTLFGFTYNLTPSIHTSFQSRSLFDLSRAGIHQTGFQDGGSSRFEVIPTFSVLENVLADSLAPRRMNYQEAYTAAWQPRLDKIEPVSWINYSISYTGGFQWRNSPIGSGLGATVSNNLSLSQTLDLNIRDWLSGMNWFNKLEQPANAEDAENGGTLGNVGREALLALLSVQSIDVSFNISTSSLQTGYAGSSKFIQLFTNRGSSTSFAYRTGISNQIGLNRLIRNRKSGTAIQLPSNRSLNDNLTIGARFLPFNNFSIDLIWNTQWDKTYTRNITLSPDQTKSIVRSQRGTVASSVWAFGAGYEKVFRKQLNIAFEDIAGQSNVISDSLGNQDGRTVLGKRTLQNTFREAYLGIGTATVGNHGFAPFPLPGWKITWTGIEKYIPFIGDEIARASLVHAYSGNYRLGYIFNVNQSVLPPLSLGSFTVLNRRSAFEPTAINIEKIFAPLIGINITWKSNLRTTLQFDYTKLTSLALSNATILERYSKGIRFTLSYTLRNFKIPLFPRIENAVDFTLNTSYIEDTETKYVLSADLDNVFEDPNLVKNPSLYDFTSSFTGGQSRINASLIVGYQFSQTIKANFEYSFSKLIPRSTGVFPRTDHDILFNIIVSIRSGG